MNGTMRPLYVNHAAYKRAMKRVLVKQGVTPIKARYDQAGNCTTCGEAGRCPGWHTTEERHP